jgi:hypothetical protein
MLSRRSGSNGGVASLVTHESLQHRARRILAAAGLCLAMASAPGLGRVAAGQTVVTWTGGAGDGNWSNPLNWNPNVVPNNSGSTLYRVVVPSGVTVVVDPTVPATLQIEELVLGTGSALSLRAGRALTVHGAADIRGSVDASLGGSLIATGAGTQITGSGSGIPTFRVGNGGSVAVGASSYSMTPIRYGNFPIFTADGTGSVLNLSSLLTLNAGWNDQDGVAYATTVSASNGGVVNLSGLQTLTTPNRGEDRIDFVTSTAGSISLNGLRQINGAAVAKFVVPLDATQSLPQLATASNLSVELGTGASFNAPLLTSVDNSGYISWYRGSDNYRLSEDYTRMFSLGQGATINAGELRSLGWTSFALGIGSVFNAPQLNQLTFSKLNLTAAGTFITAPLTNIDNTSISVSGGRQWGVSTGGMAATTYSMAGYRYGNATIFSADGAGSILDLSSITTFNAGWYDIDGVVFATTVSATNGGVVNLSGLQTLTTPNRGEDRIDFVASDGGRIELTRMATLLGVGRVTMTAARGGRFNLGDLVLTTNASASISDLESSIGIQRNIFLQGGNLSVPVGGTLAIGKHLYNQTTNEASANLSQAIVTFGAAGLHLLEVGGTDFGQMNPGNNGNFGFGRLEVGAPGVTATLQLLDLFNNGNRGTNQPEALYLYGLGQGTDSDSLRLYNGSTLYLDNINVYAMENGRWIWLNDLFATSQTVVPYGGGYLHLPTPGAAVVLAVGGLIASRRRR